MIVTAGSLEESRDALELVRHRPNLYSTVGVHPTRCSEFFCRSAEAGGESADPEAHVAALAAVLEEGKAIGKVNTFHDIEAVNGLGEAKYFCPLN